MESQATLNYSLPPQMNKSVTYTAVLSMVFKCMFVSLYTVLMKGIYQGRSDYLRGIDRIVKFIIAAKANSEGTTTKWKVFCLGNLTLLLMALKLLLRGKTKRSVLIFLIIFNLIQTYLCLYPCIGNRQKHDKSAEQTQGRVPGSIQLIYTLIPS